VLDVDAAALLALLWRRRDCLRLADFDFMLPFYHILPFFFFTQSLMTLPLHEAITLKIQEYMQVLTRAVASLFRRRFEFAGDDAEKQLSVLADLSSYLILNGFLPKSELEEVLNLRKELISIMTGSGHRRRHRRSHRKSSSHRRSSHSSSRRRRSHRRRQHW
jgi:hypothetical protein